MVNNKKPSTSGSKCINNPEVKQPQIINVKDAKDVSTVDESGMTVKRSKT